MGHFGVWLESRSARRSAGRYSSRAAWSRRKKRRCSPPTIWCSANGATRCSFSRRASRTASTRRRASQAPAAGTSSAAADWIFDAALDENADVLVLDSIGELAGLYALADADVRRRFAGSRGRPQHPRAGLVLEAAGVRPVDGKFPRHGGAVPRCEGRHPGFQRSATRESVGAAHRRQRLRERMGQPRASSPNATAARQSARSSRIADLVHRQHGAPGVTPSASAALAAHAALRRCSRISAHAPIGAGFCGRSALDGVVISVGNLTTGGTGKTPMVLWIAQRLLAEGKSVWNPDARLSRRN